MRQALSDVRVVEVAGGVAAAWCTKVFADLGAEVVKVEPPDGDDLRADPGAFAHLQTNKASVVLEVSPASASALEALVDDADLVVETPGIRALADWGLDRDRLRARRPALSVVAITGFGATGPYVDYAWSDLAAQAFAGVLLATERGPVRLPMSVAECAVGHTAAVGGLAAVLRARASGCGAFIDCAATEALASTPGRLSRQLGWEYRHGRDLPLRPVGASTTLLPVGVFPCADGYVAMMMTSQQLPEMLAILDDPALTAHFARPDAFALPETKQRLDAVLYPWLLARSRREITDVAQRAGWPVAPVHEPVELLDADHLHQRGFWIHSVDPEIGPVLLPGAPYRLSEGGWRLRRTAPRLGQADPPTRLMPTTRRPSSAAAVDPSVPPLRGVRVVDLTTVWSGPAVTLLLADLGAEVIRVENPRVFPPTTKGYQARPAPDMLVNDSAGGYADPIPGAADRPYNRHSKNNAVSRGKLSCTLDVRDPRQRELFKALIAVSDVLVENLKASTLHALGIHESELLRLNPRLIVVRIPPAGLTGDWASYTGFGGQFDGMAGLSWLAGHAGTEPYETPTTLHMDSVTGPAGAFAVLAALHYRAATGRGQVVELAQLENVVAQLGDVFVNVQLGRSPERYGNRDPRRAPQGLYPCADGGLLAVTVTDDHAWRALADVIGRPDLVHDHRVATANGRRAAHDELDEVISAWTRTVTATEGFARLQAAGVVSAPVLDERGFASDPQVVDRQWCRPLRSRDVGTFNHLGPAFRGIPLAWERGAPALGEHNEYVFTEVLGLDQEEYERLAAERVATEDYLDAAGQSV